MFADPPWSVHLLTSSLAGVLRVKEMCLKSTVSKQTEFNKMKQDFSLQSVIM